MKILLVTPSNCDLIHGVSLPLGLISIGTHLKQGGHDVKIVDLNVSHSNINSIIKSFNPDILGVSVHYQKQIPVALDVSKAAHKRGITVVWGGPFCNHITLEHFYNEGTIDIISFSEGEATWLELAEAIENNRAIDDIKGIAYKKDGRFIRNDDREFMDLSTILPADWSLVDVSKYPQPLYGAQKLVYLYLSKGCPGRCGFCFNSFFNHSRQRRKALDVFMIELKELVEKYGVDGFCLSDECAFTRKSDLYDLCDALDNAGYNLIWGFDTKMGLLDKEDLQRAYDSGCRWIHFGLESGSERMLEIINKKISFSDIAPTFNWMNEIGIVPVSTFIVGMPHETVDDLKCTVNLIKGLPNNESSVFQYGYLYGSPFGKEIYESGKYKLPSKLRDYRKVDLYNGRQPNFSEIPKKDLKVVQGYFSWKLLFKSDYSKKTNVVTYIFREIKYLCERVVHIKLRYLPEAFAETAIPLARFFFAAKFCKKTRKKYGLD